MTSSSFDLSLSRRKRGRGKEVRIKMYGQRKGERRGKKEKKGLFFHFLEWGKKRGRGAENFHHFSRKGEGERVDCRGLRTETREKRGGLGRGGEKPKKRGEKQSRDQTTKCYFPFERRKREGRDKFSATGRRKEKRRGHPEAHEKRRKKKGLKLGKKEDSGGRIYETRRYIKLMGEKEKGKKKNGTVVFLSPLDRKKKKKKEKREACHLRLNMFQKGKGRGNREPLKTTSREGKGKHYSFPAGKEEKGEGRGGGGATRPKGGDEPSLVHENFLRGKRGRY